MKRNYSLIFRSALLSLILLFSFSVTDSNAQNFAALGTGVNGVTVRAVVVYNGNLIVGGDFTTASGLSVNRIAMWNGTSWSALGSGMNGDVRALQVFGNDLYVAGNFTTAGGNSANRIAKWNGSSWTNLGLGLSGAAEVLEVHNSTLYVGGTFATAGGITVNNIASWNGTAWSGLGAGTNSTVSALRSFSNELYVGGTFTTVGGVPVGRIARWNGSNWNTVGSGVITGSAVYCFEQLGSNLVIGGFFTNIGGATSENIASWNGSSFSNMASGVTGGSVRAMTLYLGELYIGGLFTGIGGGGSLSRIGRWNGSSFTALGTGTSSDVRTLGVFDANLILGGSFTNAGPNTVNRVAKWGSIPVAPTLVSPSNGAVGVSPTPLMEWGAVTNAFDYRIQISNDPNFGSFVVNEAGVDAAEYQVGSGALNGSTVYFWRVNARNGMGTSPFSTIFFFTTTMTGIVNVSSQVPERYGLFNNYPNPFNPSTKIKFDIPASNGTSNVRLSIFDASGREVSTLINSQISPGSYEFEFNAKDLTSGVYFYRLTAGNFVETKKMMLVK